MGLPPEPGAWSHDRSFDFEELLRDGVVLASKPKLRQGAKRRERTIYRDRVLRLRVPPGVEVYDFVIRQRPGM